MPDDGESYDPDVERVQERAVDRQHERTETVEDALDEDVGIFDEAKYPVTSEELAVEYGDEIVDLPNESESLGSVVDRLVDERFESPTELREAIYHEITGEAAGPEEYDGRRPLSELDGGGGGGGGGGGSGGGGGGGDDDDGGAVDGQRT